MTSMFYTAETMYEQGG